MILNNKKLPVMFVVGLLALLYGLSSLYIGQSANKVSIVFSIVGFFLLLIVFLQKGRGSFRSFNLNQFKKTSFVIAGAVLPLVLWFSINYFTSLLPWQWDVTSAKQHTLSADTNALIKGLNQDVKLTAFFVGTPPKYLEDLFKAYAKASCGRIKTEIVDPVEQIGYAAQFGNVINAQERKVIVTSGQQKREVIFTNSPLSQEKLTNAIVRVARPRRFVYFLTGHGELNIENKDDQGLSTLAQLLDSNNFGSKNLMLGIEKKIPADCAVLVIAGPKDFLTIDEDRIVEEYLEKGGRVLFLVENIVVSTPDKPLTAYELHMNPSLNEILNLWGLNVNDDVVVDLASHAGDDVGCPATKNYIKHQALTEGLDYTFYIRPRSITELKNRRPTIRLAPIVLTASKEQSWGETNRYLHIHFDKDVDMPGPVPIAYVVWEGKRQGGFADTRLILFTNADFLSNVYINQYSNAKMGLNVINWLADADYKVFVDQKVIKVERLDLTSRQKREVLLVLFFMPFFVACAGIMVWMKGEV